MENNARRDPRAAVGDDVSVGHVRKRLVPRSVPCARDVARNGVDRLDVAAVALGDTRVEEDQVAFADPPLELLGVDRVAGALLGHERRRLDRLVAGPERPVPRVELDHGAVVVAEVAQEPPEPLGAAHRAVRDDEDARPDPGERRGGGEVVGARKRMAPTQPGRGGEVALDVEERRAGDVPGEVELAPAVGVAELPSAVDEAVTHPRRS